MMQREVDIRNLLPIILMPGLVLIPKILNGSISKMVPSFQNKIASLRKYISRQKTLLRMLLTLLSYGCLLTMLHGLVEEKMARDRMIRLQIMLDNEESETIKAWQFKNRMPSKAAAVREIMRRGLAADGFKMATFGTHSEKYGIVHSPAQNGKTGGTE